MALRKKTGKLQGGMRLNGNFLANQAAKARQAERNFHVRKRADEERKRSLKGRGVLDDIKRGFENFAKHPMADSNDFKNHGERIKKAFGGGKRRS